MHTEFRDFLQLQPLSTLGETSYYKAVSNGDPCLLRISSSPHPSKECEEGMQNEKNLLGELNGDSPFFPRVLEHDYWQDYLFTVFEIPELQTVSDWRQNRSDPETMLEVSTRLLKGIEFLHKKGIFLGCIFLSGLFITEKNIPVILGLDNGLGDMSDGRFTGTVEQLCTCSPEMTGRTGRTVDWRSDIYSLGTLLYFILSGTFPIFDTDSPELIHKILTEPPQDIAIPSGLNEQRPLISDIIGKTLQKDPDKRYQNSSILLYDWMQLGRMRKSSDSRKEFAAGTQDRRHGLSEAAGVYGRNEELEKLKDVYRKARNKQSCVFNVLSEAGMGKTCLVEQFRNRLDGREHFFLRVKFDQYREASSYSGITRLLEDAASVTNRLLPAETAQWRSRMEESLGDRALILRDLCTVRMGILPDRGGEEGPESVPLHPPQIIYSTVMDFFRLLASGGRTLIVFLDDIQWIDNSLSRLVEELVKNPVPGLLLIQTMRKGDAAATEKFMSPMENSVMEMTGITLENLKESSVSSMIADISPLPGEMNDRLAGFLHNRTKGNPLFLHEYIQEINKREFVYFNMLSGQWDLDYPGLINLPVFDTELELIRGIIDTIPVMIRSVLIDISHLVSVFSLSYLTDILPHPRDLIRQTLDYCLRERILIETEASDSLKEKQFCFVHDKIKEAVYALHEAQSSRKLHSDIMMKLLKKRQTRSVGEGLRIASHLLQSGQLPESLPFYFIHPILLQAAESHFSTQNIEAALDVLRFIIRNHTADLWRKNSSDSHLVFKMAVECCYRLNLEEEAREYAGTVMEYSGNSVEKAALKELQMNHSFPRGEILKALKYGEDGLRLLGLAINTNPGSIGVMRQFLVMKKMMGRKRDEEILSLKENRSEKGRVAVRLYAGYIPPAYNSGKLNLFGTAVLRSAQLSLRYGLSPESAAGFIGYAILLSALGDHKEAFRIGRLAIRINDRFSDAQWRPMVYMLYLLFCVPWQEEWSQMDRWIEKVKEASRICGETLYNANAVLDQGLWTPMLGLNELIDLKKKSILLLENLGQFATIAVNKAYLHSYSVMAGIHPPDEGSPGHEKDIQTLLATHQLSAAALCHLNTARTALFFEQEEKYRDCLRSMGNLSRVLSGACYEEELMLYSLILHLRLLRSGGGIGRNLTAYFRVRSIIRKFYGWSKQNPLFLQHYYLGKALLSSLRKSPAIRTVHFFERAVKAADRHHFLRYRALFRELAADYCFSVGLDQYAVVLLKDSVSHYQHYGAMGVIRKIQDKYPILIQTDDSHTPGRKNLSTDLDVHSILKASQSLAQEIELKQLIRSILRLIIQNSGAGRGLLILVKDGVPGLVLDGDRNQMTEQPFREVEGYESISHDLIYEALNSRKPVIVNKEVSLSRLCFPFVSKQQVRALVYLENDLVGGVFTEDRLQVLRLLSSAIVVSLENAALYSSLRVMNEELEQRVEERTRELDLANTDLKEKLQTIEELSSDLRQMAIRDELTALYNRRYLNDIFPGLLSAGRREGSALAVLMIDADKFKTVNDRFGHSVGDLVLKRIARELQDNSRMHDQVFRLGGEEFMILSPSMKQSDALTFAEKLRRNIENIDFSDVSSELRITVSIGVTISDLETDNPERLMNLADIALYKAKEKGRNRVETALESNF